MCTRASQDNIYISTLKDGKRYSIHVWSCILNELNKYRCHFSRCKNIVSLWAHTWMDRGIPRRSSKNTLCQSLSYFVQFSSASFQFPQVAMPNAIRATVRRSVAHGHPHLQRMSRVGKPDLQDGRCIYLFIRLVSQYLTTSTSPRYSFSKSLHIFHDTRPSPRLNN